MWLYTDLFFLNYISVQTFIIDKTIFFFMSPSEFCFRFATQSIYATAFKKYRKTKKNQKFLLYLILRLHFNHLNAIFTTIKTKLKLSTEIILYIILSSI